MSFVQREIDRLRKALLATPDGDRRNKLYAAQQALSWALEPGGIKSPYDMITDTEAEPRDCSVPPRPPQS